MKKCTKHLPRETLGDSYNSTQIKLHPNSCLYPLLNYLGPDAIRSKCTYVQCADIHMCRDEGFSLTIVSKNERFHHDRFDGNGGNFAWNRVPSSSNSESPSICTARLSQCFYIILYVQKTYSLFQAHQPGASHNGSETRRYVLFKILLINLDYKVLTMVFKKYTYF